MHCPPMDHAKIATKDGGITAQSSPASPLTNGRQQNVERSADATAVVVGSTVRIVLPATSSGGHPTKKRHSRRATVATFNSSSSNGIASAVTVTILLEDFAPRPLSLAPETDHRRKRLNRPFLVLPPGNAAEEFKEVVEMEVLASELNPLLPFEAQSSEEDSWSVGAAESAERLKGHGDELFKLGDYGSATSYYEASLSLTSLLSIGSTVILNMNGRTIAAEVDCIDDDGLELEICYPDGAEGIVKESDVLLCIKEDDEDGLQERTLMNLARCLLNLSDLDDLRRRAQYGRGAVFACTLALACLAHRVVNSGDTQNDFCTNALLVRSRAYLGLSKFKHAKGDVQKILKANPGNKEAAWLQAEIVRATARKKRVDKKLAKEMCSWVKEASEKGDLEASNLLM